MQHVMMKPLCGVLVSMLLLSATACSGRNDADSEPQFVEDMHAFMNEDIDVVADKIWDKQGYIITVEGEEKLFPKTDEGWADVAAAADEMIALSTELATEKYSRGEQDWVIYSDGLAVAAEQVKQAALEQDEEAVFEAGGLMYRVCRACHERFRAYEDLEG